jgi:hypothetical protein
MTFDIAAALSRRIHLKKASLSLQMRATFRQFPGSHAKLAPDVYAHCTRLTAGSHTHTHPNFQPAGSRKQEEVILQPSFPARSFPLEAQTLHISLLVTEYIYARGPITDLYSFARSTNLLFVMHPLIRSLSITFFSHVLFPVAVQVTFL